MGRGTVQKGTMRRTAGPWRLCISGRRDLRCRVSWLSLHHDRCPGVTETDGESFEASEEECAKQCFISKNSCTSFSTRPGKNDKKDLCLLDTVFENQVILDLGPIYNANFRFLTPWSRKLLGTTTSLM